MSSRAKLAVSATTSVTYQQAKQQQIRAVQNTQILQIYSITDFFVLSSGIRQGGVLSPYLFAVYVNKCYCESNGEQRGVSPQMVLYERFAICGRHFIISAFYYCFTAVDTCMSERAAVA